MNKQFAALDESICSTTGDSPTASLALLQLPKVKTLFCGRPTVKYVLTHPLSPTVCAEVLVPRRRRRRRRQRGEPTTVPPSVSGQAAGLTTGRRPAAGRPGEEVRREERLIRTSHATGLSHGRRGESRAGLRPS